MCRSKGLSIEIRNNSIYPESFMTDADYTDDLTITSNNNKDAESMLHKI